MARYQSCSPLLLAYHQRCASTTTWTVGIQLAIHSPTHLRTPFCKLPVLDFVGFFGDVSITAAHYPHLDGLPGAFGASFYSHVGDLPRAAIATAGFTGLASASASASASAHRASPS